MSEGVHVLTNEVGPCLARAKAAPRTPHHRDSTTLRIFSSLEIIYIGELCTGSSIVRGKLYLNNVREHKLVLVFVNDSQIFFSFWAISL